MNVLLQLRIHNYWVKYTGAGPRTISSVEGGSISFPSRSNAFLGTDGGVVRVCHARGRRWRVVRP